MAFAARDLSVLAYANGFTLWHYTSIDDATAITAADYFSDAADMLRVGDLIIINQDTDGSLSTAMYTVTANDGQSISITVFTA